VPPLPGSNYSVEHCPSCGVQTRSMSDLLLCSHVLLRDLSRLPWEMTDPSGAPVDWHEEKFRQYCEKDVIRIGYSLTPDINSVGVDGSIQVHLRALIDKIQPLVKDGKRIELVKIDDILSVGAREPNNEVLKLWAHLFGAQIATTFTEWVTPTIVRWMDWGTSFFVQDEIFTCLNQGMFSRLDQFGSYIAHRRQIQTNWNRFFEEGNLDAILVPCVVGGPAFPHNPSRKPLSVTTMDGKEVKMGHFAYSITVTAAMNIGGLPTTTIPLVQNSQQLPLGALLASKRWNDEGLIAITERVCEFGDISFCPPLLN
jgi:Asp-tRNA(Asn)/Glu-tRNA(Gln) amidotransferase A subunit family amidase